LDVVVCRNWISTTLTAIQPGFRRPRGNRSRELRQVRPSAPSAHTKPPPTPGRTGPRCRYWRGAELMRLTLGLPLDTCPHCSGRMKLRALVRDRESIERFLRHQNLWTEPLGLAEARPPPYYRSVTRLRRSPQVELFE